MNEILALTIHITWLPLLAAFVCVFLAGVLAGQMEGLGGSVASVMLILLAVVILMPWP